VSLLFTGFLYRSNGNIIGSECCNHQMSSHIMRW
jgi:hypothetical protein